MLSAAAIQKVLCRETAKTGIAWRELRGWPRKARFSVNAKIVRGYTNGRWIFSRRKDPFFRIGENCSSHGFTGVDLCAAFCIARRKMRVRLCVMSDQLRVVSFQLLQNQQ